MLAYGFNGKGVIITDVDASHQLEVLSVTRAIEEAARPLLKK